MENGPLIITVIFLSLRIDRSWQTVQTQGLHCLQFPLHLLDALLWRKRYLVKLLGWLQQFFLVSEYLGNLRYKKQTLYLFLWQPIILLWRIWVMSGDYRKFPKYSDTPKICCIHSKNWTVWLYHRVMSPNDADGMANSVDPDQTARSRLNLVCKVCPGLSVRKLRIITVWYFSVFRKIIFQTSMCSHPVGLDIWFLVGPFGYILT